MQAKASHKNLPFLTRLGFAYAGLVHALRYENSLRVHLAALVAVIVALIVLHPGPVWWAIALLACTLVITAELINTALEHLVDHLHPEIHPRIKIVKDCAAAAVLIASIGSLAIAAALLIAAWPFR